MEIKKRKESKGQRLKGCLLFLMMIFNLSFNVMANKKITNISFVEKDDLRLIIELSDKIQDLPDFSFQSNTMELTFEKNKSMFFNNPVTKKFFTENNEEISILSKEDLNQSSLQVMLPFNVEKIKNNINIFLELKKIIISFPKNALSHLPKISSVSKIPKVNTFLKEETINKKKEVTEKGKKKEKTALDEAYLNKIMNSDITEEDKKEKNIKNENVVAVKKANDLFYKKIKKEDKSKEKIIKRNDITSSYITKFLLFFTFVISLIAGLFYLFKKGFLGKNKFSLLSGKKLVNIIDNTYLGPKRSLLTIKVNNQVFLLANTEAGINFISEIDEVTKALKTSESDLLGKNFDERVDDSLKDEKTTNKIKLKKNNDEDSLEEMNILHQFINKNEKENIVSPEDKVYFSGKLKEKIKALRPLQ